MTEVKPAYNTSLELRKTPISLQKPLGVKTYADISNFHSRGKSGQRLDFNWLRVEITKQNLLTPYRKYYFDAKR